MHLDRDTHRRITTALDARLTRRDAPGLQYMLVSADQVLIEYAAGLRDVKTEQPVLPSTQFLSASTTKLLTAAGILMLHQSGRLSIDDTLSRHLPDQPYGPQVTLRSMLNHTSGIPNPLPLRWLHTADAHPHFDEAVALRQVLARFPHLTHEPGRRYAYSNLAYWLLGRVIACVAGVSYSSYMEAEVFGPLGIGQHITFVMPKEDFYARGHMRRISPAHWLMRAMTDREIWASASGGWARFSPLYMNGAPYGGAYATSMGYARFLQDLLRDTPHLCSPATRELFFSDQCDLKQARFRAGLGWAGASLLGESYYSKPGGGPGCQANVRVYRRLGLASVMLANCTTLSESAIEASSDQIDRLWIEAITR